jgi:glycosyltransferase involved in cell wall biosynthesis
LACDAFLKYTTRLARGMAERGCDVTLVTRNHGLEFGAWDADDEMRSYVRSVLGEHGRHRELVGRVSDVTAVRPFLELRRQLAEHRPDAIHVQDSAFNDPRLLAVTRARRRRYALTVHDAAVHPGDVPLGRRRTAIRRELIRHAGVIFVHSDVIREELLARSGTRAPVEVVPHGTGTPEATPLPRDPTMLFFGRLVHYKGLDVLLDALPQVWASVPDARLVVAGEGQLPVHPLLADGRVEIRHEHIPEGDLPGYFRRTRAVVLPYREASQSGVGSQAKMFGRPLVTTAVGGLPELVADGSGVAVAPEDPASLARALVDVLSAPDVGESMARAAKAGAAAADWPQVAERTIEAYERHLLGARPRR